MDLRKKREYLRRDFGLPLHLFSTVGLIRLGCFPVWRNRGRSNIEVLQKTRWEHGLADAL